MVFQRGFLPARRLVWVTVAATALLGGCVVAPVGYEVGAPVAYPATVYPAPAYGYYDYGPAYAPGYYWGPSISLGIYGGRRGGRDGGRHWDGPRHRPGWSHPDRGRPGADRGRRPGAERPDHRQQGAARRPPSSRSALPPPGPTGYQAPPRLGPAGGGVRRSDLY